MIKFEHTEVLGWEHAIRGMRNPMNSWEKSDSHFDCSEVYEYCDECPNYSGDGPVIHCRLNDTNERFVIIGPNDLDLMKRLRNAGTDHRKFMRMITVYVDITAPLYWWKEFDTYKVGTVANSCSTMHKIADKEFTLEDFSCEHLITPETAPGEHDWTGEYYDVPIVCLKYVIDTLNLYRKKYLETKDKKYWWQMIQLLPSSYNQKRTVMLNYEVLANIYNSRKNHKLDEWSGKDCFKDLARNCNTCVKKETSECYSGKEGGFIQWIESLPYSEIIIGEPEEKKNLKNIQISDEIMEEAKRRVCDEFIDRYCRIPLNCTDKDNK